MGELDWIAAQQRQISSNLGGLLDLNKESIENEKLVVDSLRSLAGIAEALLERIGDLEQRVAALEEGPQ
jgi:hypothetical protein